MCDTTHNLFLLAIGIPAVIIAWAVVFILVLRLYQLLR